MADLSFIEKINILVEVSKSSIMYAIIIALMLFLGLILVTTNKKNASSSRKLFIALYVFIGAGIFLLYKESITGMIEYLMNNLFVIIYFPNLAVYFAALLITNILLWISVFSFNTHRFIKNVNIVVYLLFNYLLVVLLATVNNQKLDVFNQTSIYGNQTARAIIELTSTLFITWIIFLFLYKVIITYLTRNKSTTKVKVVKKVVEKPIGKILIKRKLPESVRPISVPYMVKATTNEQVIAPVITQSEPLNEFDKLLTLDDYKLLLSMLKEKKEKERLDAFKRETQEKEIKKFEELQGLYSVR